MLRSVEILFVFPEFINSHIADRQNIIGNLNEVFMSIFCNAALEEKQDALENECGALMELIYKTVRKTPDLRKERVTAMQSAAVCLGVFECIQAFG